MGALSSNVTASFDILLSYIAEPGLFLKVMGSHNIKTSLKLAFTAPGTFPGLIMGIVHLFRVDKKVNVGSILTKARMPRI